MGSDANTDEMWRCWGWGRARKTADEIIARYHERGVPDWGVMIRGARRGSLPRWYFTAWLERKGQPR
jgi:hypothetical protein